MQKKKTSIGNDKDNETSEGDRNAPRKKASGTRRTTTAAKK